MLKTVGNPSTRFGDQTIVNGNLVIGTAGKGVTTGTSIPLGLGTNNGTDAVTIDIFGNVGIGTNTPGVKVDVVGSARFVGTTNSVKLTAFNNGGEVTVARDDSTGSQFGVPYATNIFATGAYPILIWTNTARRIEVDANGNFITNVNSTAPTLSANTTMSFELTSNTSLKIVVRGSDGVTRSASLTLA
jgi:hypothetical protein